MSVKLVNISFNTTSTKTLSDYFEDFLLFKRAQGNCINTENQYKYHFGRFIKCCNDTLDVGNIKNGLIKIFSELSCKSNVTYNMTYKYLNCFFNWCKKNSILEVNPIKELDLKKKREVSKAVDISYSIIEKVLKSFNLKTYTGFRNYVIMLTTLDTGLRPCELLNITIDDINFISKHILIREEISKTREERFVHISDIIVDLLKKLISIIPKEWSGNYIFYTNMGDQFTSYHWTYAMNKHCKKIGVKITPYDLRHIFAINFLRNKGNIFVLQRLMGHSDLSMTKKYIALSQVDIDEEHTLASPINNLVKRNTRVINIFNQRRC